MVFITQVIRHIWTKTDICGMLVGLMISSSLPYVLECAATSIPDALRGQAIKASIVLADGIEASEALKKEIMKYLRGSLASYKRPKTIEFVSALPKTSSGKVRRTEIKEKDWDKGTKS